MGIFHKETSVVGQQGSTVLYSYLMPEMAGTMQTGSVLLDAYRPKIAPSARLVSMPAARVRELQTLSALPAPLATPP